MAIPARKRAHFVVIQAHLTFGTLNTFLDRPARSGHPHQFGQGCVRFGKDDIASQFTRIADAATDEQEALPALERRSAHLHTPPIVTTISLTARASAEPFPAQGGQLS